MASCWCVAETVFRAGLHTTSATLDLPVGTESRGESQHVAARRLDPSNFHCTVPPHSLITPTALTCQHQTHLRNAQSWLLSACLMPIQHDSGDPRVTGAEDLQDDPATQPEVYFNGPTSSDTSTLVPTLLPIYTVR